VTDMSLSVVNSTIKSKVLINPNDGLKVQKNTGTSGAPVWSDQISLDSSGNALFGGVLSIGSGGAVVKADGNTGLWVGASAFANAPFRVELNGRITATNVNLTGGSLGWGNFNVNSAGVITATGANISGNITANALTAGAFIQAPVINGGTITGTTIQTSQPGMFPRVELSSSYDMISVYYNANNYLRLSSNYTEPAIEFFSGGIQQGLIQAMSSISGMYIGSDALYVVANYRISLQAGEGGIEFLSTGKVRYNGHELATQRWVNDSVVAKWG